MSNAWLGAGLLKLSDGCNINRKTRPYKPFNDNGARSQEKIILNFIHPKHRVYVEEEAVVVTARNT